MTFVQQYSGETQAAASWSAGDTLVAVLTTMRQDSNVPELEGWDREWVHQLFLQVPRYYVAFQTVVWTRKQMAAGSGVIRPSPKGEVASSEFSVFRYSQATKVSATSYTIQNAVPTWPPSPVNAAGDVVHIASTYRGPVTPAGDTVRREIPTSPVSVSDRTTTGPVAAARAPEGTPRDNGASLTLHLASTPPVPTPVLTSPTTEAVDATQPVTVAWGPVQGQTAFSIRRTAAAGGAVSYWNGSSWVSSPTNVTSTASSANVTLGSGTWTLSVSIMVGTSSSAWSAGKLVVSSAPPAAPTTVAVSSWSVRRPTITVTGAATSGYLAGYRIEVLDGSGEVLESVLDPDGSWKPTLLPDGAITVRAAIVQNGDQQGPWKTVSGTVAVPPVPVPTVSAEVHYLADTVPPGGLHTDGLPGIRLTVQTTVVNGLVEVNRGGEITTAEISSAAQFDEYTLGDGEYRVRVGDVSRDPVEWSPWVVVDLPPLSQVDWLVAPQAPERSVKVSQHSYDEAPPDLRSQVNAYLDDSWERIVLGVPVRARRQAEFGVDSRWKWERLEALLQSGLLLRMAWRPSWEGTPTPSDVFRVASYNPSRLVAEQQIDKWRVSLDMIPQEK